MQILILIDVQYLQNIGFWFEKGLNGQKHAHISKPSPKFPKICHIPHPRPNTYVPTYSYPPS